MAMAVPFTQSNTSRGLSLKMTNVTTPVSNVQNNAHMGLKYKKVDFSCMLFGVIYTTVLVFCETKNIGSLRGAFQMLGTVY